MHYLNVDERMLKTIMRLQQNDDFKLLLEWLRTERLKLLDELAMANHPDSVRWLQGVCQLLGDLDQTITNASRTVLALQNTRQRTL